MYAPASQKRGGDLSGANQRYGYLIAPLPWGASRKPCPPILLPQVGRDRSKLGQAWTRILVYTISAEAGPEFGRMRLKFDQHRLEFGRCHPKMDDVDRSWPVLGRLRTNIGRGLPTSAAKWTRFGRTRVQSGPIRARVWLDAGERRPNVGRVAPGFGRISATPTALDPILACLCCW